MTTNNNFNAAIVGKKATRIPTTAQTSRSRACSLNIVCAKNNRKSITLHKKIAEKLALDSNVFVTVYNTEGYIVFSPVAINQNSVAYKFSNTISYIIYNAALVQFLAEIFELDYTQRTSISFRDIEFTTSGDTPVAIVTIKKVAVDEEEDTDETEAQDNA